MVLSHADNQATDHVNHHDHNPGDGITTDKLTGPVHRTVEIGLLGHFCTAAFGFFIIDDPGVQIRINRHLLARHTIEHEARTDFGDTSRTFGDNHKVN